MLATCLIYSTKINKTNREIVLMSDMFSRKKRMAEKIFNAARKVNNNPEQKLFAPYNFILNYSNNCNFSCPHCFAGAVTSGTAESNLSLDDLYNLGNQADELGIYEIDIQGGEPLLFPNLFDILDALGIDRFYTYITTNGWLLTQELADKLANAGVDRISVSIDSFTAEKHDEFRQKKGSFKRAIKALEYTKRAGMKPFINIVIGHYNAQSDELRFFCEQMLDKNYGVAFNCATPTGNWQGNYDIMLSSEDTECIMELRYNNKEIIRDLWNYFNINNQLIRGCPSVNLFYINPSGDVLPCPYIQTKIGNIKEQPLKEVLEYGFSFKELNTYSPICSAGENIEFARNFLNKETSVLNPMAAIDFFSS